MTPTATAVLVSVIAAATSVLSATLALSGVVLARRLEAKAERERNARDRKVSSYQELIEQYFKLREAVRDVATVDPDQQSTDANSEEVRTLGARWNSAVFGVWLHGSRDVAVHVRELDEEMNVLVRHARQEKYTLDEWHAERSSAARLMDKFLDVVRVELGLPAHMIISEYKA